MALPDNPIKNKENDLFNRVPMAKHVASLVNDFQGNESFVVGIEGEWGSGKTSFINFICEEIDSNKAEVIFFNPWNFSTQDQLIQELFNLILEKLSSMGSTSKAIKTLKKYKQKLNVEVSPTFFGINLGKIGFDLSSLDTLRREIEEELLKLDKKILIIIDDIDRLDKRETLEIFKLVKVTANFPNCIFFLAYDRGRVIKRIDSKNEKYGEDYLKKIIQTTFRLPTIDRSQIENMLFKQIDQILEDLFGSTVFSEEDRKRWSSIVYAGFPDLFQNIRDLKRYLSSLKLNLSIIGKHEINIVDFIALESIRVFAPDFYDEIPKNSWVFTGSFGTFFSYTAKQDKRPEVFEKIVKQTLIDHPQKEQIFKILKELFPRIEFSTNYGSDWESIWAGNKQVCSYSKFLVYFQLSVPPDEISEEEFDEIMTGLSDKKIEEIAYFIEILDKDNRLKDFVYKIQNKFDSYYINNKETIINLCCAFFSQVGKIENNGEDIIDVRAFERQVYRFVSKIIEKLNGEEDKYNFLQKVLDSNDYLFAKVNLVRNLLKENTGLPQDIIDREKALKRIVSELVSVLEKAIKEDTLKKEFRGGDIIWAYKDWGKEQEIRQYIEKLGKSESDIFILLDWFKSEVDSSNRGRYYQISKKSVESWISLDILNKTILLLDREKISKENKELLDLYEKEEEIW